MVRDIQRILSHKESKHPAGHPKVPPKQIQKKNETQKLLFRESPRGLRKEKFCRSGFLVASKIMPFREVSWESPGGLLRKHKKKRSKKKLKAAAGVETHGKQGAAIGDEPTGVTAPSRDGAPCPGLPARRNANDRTCAGTSRSCFMLRHKQTHPTIGFIIFIGQHKFTKFNKS